MKFGRRCPCIIIRLILVVLEESLRIKVEHLSLLELVYSVGKYLDKLKVSKERNSVVNGSPPHEKVVFQALGLIRRDIDAKTNVIGTEHVDDV